MVIQHSDDFSLGPMAEFMRTLWQLNHVLERASRRMESQSGVTAQQRMIIRCVGKYPGMTAGQLATHLHVDAGTVSAAIDRLEQKGLLERRKAQRDRRRVMLGLTAAGRAVDASAPGPTEQALNGLLQTAESQDVDCARRVLSSLSNLIERTLNGDPERLHD
jgi:MarR family transcriptional regulator, organic hydroperoxide resistance regulator